MIPWSCNQCCCAVHVLCDPMDCSPSGSSVHGIFQARILEWVAISYSRGSSQSVIQTPISCIYCISKKILYPLAPPGKACRMKHTLGSILPGEISISSDMQMISPLRQKVKSLSCVRLFATLWTAALQAPPSIGSSRQEYWSGLPFLSPGDFPNPGTEPRFPALQADALPSEPPEKPSL